MKEPIVEPPDLLGLNDPVPIAPELGERNALAIAIVPVVEQTTFLCCSCSGKWCRRLGMGACHCSNQMAVRLLLAKWPEDLTSLY